MLFGWPGLRRPIRPCYSVARSPWSGTGAWNSASPELRGISAWLDGEWLLEGPFRYTPVFPEYQAMVSAYASPGDEPAQRGAVVSLPVARLMGRRIQLTLMKDEVNLRVQLMARKRTVLNNLECNFHVAQGIYCRQQKPLGGCDNRQSRVTIFFCHLPHK